jgi:hypothetical protein
VTYQNQQLTVIDRGQLVPQSNTRIASLPVPKKGWFESEDTYQVRVQEFQAAEAKKFEAYVDNIEKVERGHQRLEDMTIIRTTDSVRRMNELETIQKEVRDRRNQQSLVGAELDTARMELLRVKEQNELEILKIQNEKRRVLGLLDAPVEAPPKAIPAPPPPLTPREQINLNLRELQEAAADEAAAIEDITALNPPDLENQIDLIRHMFEGYRAEIMNRKNRS